MAPASLTGSSSYAPRCRISTVKLACGIGATQAQTIRFPLTFPMLAISFKLIPQVVQM